MSLPVERKCTEILPTGASRTGEEDPQPLSAYRATPAYVLLGDPGSGKTTEFEQECETLGAAAEYVRARKFVKLDLDSHSEWRDKILFIDGLDEMRAGATDARIPLDEIRSRLELLGKPRFRISCREADWLGPNDRRSLEEVYPDPGITVLLLDELSEQAIRDLLAEQVGIDNVESFRENTERHGLGAMLRNPHTLKLLAKAVGLGTAWPESRLETFELACRRMSAEYNEEHQVAATGYPTKVILDAAGHLCALLLLCGFEGYTLAPGVGLGRTDSTGLVPLDDIEPGIAKLSRRDLKATLSTNLFTSRDERGFIPCHRQVAEFLAGRYLASLIGKDLPARRVVELMTGSTDGRVVTVLRGLSAWLAAHPGEARRQLIDADPVGAGLYGDIGGFSINDKERLLHSLAEFAAEGPLLGHQRRDNRADGYRDDTGWAFRSLAVADMAVSVRNLLNSAAEGSHGDRTAAFVTSVLAHAEEPQKESLAALEPELMAILRDPTRPVWVKRRSLEALARIAPIHERGEQALIALLQAIQDGTIPDPDDTLRRVLLKSLYPSALGPADIWRYALPRPHHGNISDLVLFWRSDILRTSSDKDIADLLDALREDADRLVPALVESDQDDLPVLLLARCLDTFGETLDAEHLLDWLNISGRMHAALQQRQDEARSIREWLERRSEMQRTVFLAWLRRRVASEPDSPHRYWFCDALHNSRLPGRFGLWLLEQATELEHIEPALAQELLIQAYAALEDPSIGEGLTLAVMRERVGTGVLARHLDELCDRHSASPAEDDEQHREQWEQRRRERDAEKRQRQQEWADGLRPQLDDLHGNRFFAPNLHTLAQAYLGMLLDTDGEAPSRKCIRHFIGDDETLVEAVMTALQEAVFRDDVPGMDETISLHAESRHSWLAYPVLASLHLLDSKDPDRLDGLSEDRKRSALAIHYCVPSDGESHPWHDRWFQQEPQLVLEVLYRCAVREVRAGAEFVPCLNDLDSLGGHDDSVPVLAFDKCTGLFEARSPEPRFGGHGDLVHDTLLRVLDSIPVRGPKKQIALLDNLLARAMQHPDRASLRELAARKSSLTSMAVAQRVRWLTVDALLSVVPSLQPVKEYVSAKNTEVRVRHLAEFLHRTSHRDDMSRSVLAGVRDPEVLQDAIEILGASFGPVEWGGGYITLGMEMSELMGILIEQLSALAGDNAVEALESLVDNPGLMHWRDRLTAARERQRVVHRDASYRHPSIDQVQRTLSGGAPTNAAALAALLQDRIADIAADLRGGDSNPWRQFWNVDRYGRPTEPRPENPCRDALVDELRSRLPPEVTVAPESRHASETQSDIGAWCSGFKVPIEIKKNSHPDLWTAIRTQLIDMYTTDPTTSGYGIYLVLWFGTGETKTLHDGKRPDTPEDLRRWLEQKLTPDEARRISVVVLDVTKPGG